MKTLQNSLAEFIGTFALLFIGIGATYSTGEEILTVALAHGLIIAVMASSFGYISGGYFNPAVTLGSWLGGKLPPLTTLLYIIAQLAGALAATYICLPIFESQGIIDTTPQIVEGLTIPQAVLIEGILTFFLMLVIFGTGLDERAPKLGGLMIGLTVSVDILCGGPLTGAAMNPARVFAPAVAANFWSNHWVYWVGPIAGALLAALAYRIFFALKH
jgi:MIP family channel proteins